MSLVIFDELFRLSPLLLSFLLNYTPSASYAVPFCFSYRDFLLSIYGIVLKKSTECIRLLTLGEPAFPARIFEIQFKKINHKTIVLRNYNGHLQLSNGTLTGVFGASIPSLGRVSVLVSASFTLHFFSLSSIDIAALALATVI
ncbi:uncharacterized protein LOC141652892 [Silene latifolia]|uniref:uncharacterized protein LOC141652892 n=1 Tax=Silene latifolia TaxID=37657 RepID=UPI003D7819BD